MERDFYQEITDICTGYFQSDETLTIWDLADRVMSLDGLPMHCPPHHYMIPAVLMTVVYKMEKRSAAQLAENLGQILERAKHVLGGFCGNYGDCGAAVGIGIFTSVYLNASPKTEGKNWSLPNRGTGRCLLKIAEVEGPRCCKRNTYLAFEEAVDFLEEELGIHLVKKDKVLCRFYKNNRECKLKQCPFFPKSKADLEENETVIIEAAQADKDSRCECELHPSSIQYHDETGEWKEGLDDFAKETAQENRDIDLYLISGFLGSGKTTLLKKMLSGMGDKKIGVLVNEFGGVGIDGTLVEREGMHLIEISNGSIFCSCLKGEFVKTLIGFTKLDVDILVVENSGLADPSSIHTLLDELMGKTERGYHYKGAVCVVDSVSFTRHVKVLTPIQNQIISSNFIIINKIDLVNEVTLEEIRTVIEKLNPNAVRYETMFSDVPLDFLKDHLEDNGYVGETSNHPWNRPASYALECDEDISEEKLKEFIKSLSVEMLRGKGFAKIENQWFLFDSTTDQWSFEPYVPKKRDLMVRTKIVMILNGHGDFKKELYRQWDRIMGCPVNIYE